MLRFELPVNQKVIHNSAVLAAHHPVKDLAGLESSDFICKYVVYKTFCIRSADENLSHVTYVEHPDLFPYGIVLQNY